MNLWSSLNGNLEKAPEQVAAVDMEKNRVKGPGRDLLVDPADLGKDSKKPVILSVVAVGVAACLAFNIIGKLTADDISDTFAVTAMSNNAVIELYENPLKVNSYEDGEWIYEEAVSVSENLSEIADQLPVVVWNDTFDMNVPEEAAMKWFCLYDEDFEQIGRYSDVQKIKDILADAEPATYYAVAGANWDGKYVLKSFTNESFSSEFVVAVVKE